MIKKYTQFIKEMKIIDKEVIGIEKFKIDYENGVFCNVELKNGKLDHYQFNSDGRNLYYISDIEKYKESHWWDHLNLLKSEVKLTLEELYEFGDFSKLFYIGGGSDGMVRDWRGEAISILLKFDDTFNKIHGGINTLPKAEEFKRKAEEIPWIGDIKIVEIPYYNRDDDKGDTHSIEFTALLPQDLYLELLGDKKYLDDWSKRGVYKFIG
jgi:hypothetical protein